MHGGGGTASEELPGRDVSVSNQRLLRGKGKELVLLSTDAAHCDIYIEIKPQCMEKCLTEKLTDTESGYDEMRIMETAMWGKGGKEWWGYIEGGW